MSLYLTKTYIKQLINQHSFVREEGGIVSFIVHFLCTRHCSKCFTGIELNPLNNLK